MAVWAQMPAERTGASGGSNDHRTSRRHHDGSGDVIDAEAQGSMVPPETTSPSCFSRRESDDADNGHDERNGKEFDHGIPSSVFLIMY